jgi:hypothetical protein
MGGAELNRPGNTAIVGRSRGITTRKRSASTPASITVNKSTDAQTRLSTDGLPKRPTLAVFSVSLVTGLLPEIIICCKYSGVATEFASHAPGENGAKFHERSDVVQIEHLASQKSNSNKKTSTTKNTLANLESNLDNSGHLPIAH